MSETVGVGVIGVGVFGSLHARVYSELSGVELVAVADQDAGRLEECASELGAAPHTDFNELVARDDIQVVSVCTPDDGHVEPVLAAARAGKHVLVEKPLATNLTDCDRIIDCVAETGTKLMVGHILRFDPRYYLARQAIMRGEIGKLVHFYARRNNQVSSAERLGRRSTPLFFLGIHDIDFINWCVGARPVRVYGESAKALDEIESSMDSVLALIRFDNGAIASLETTWVLPRSFPSKLDARFEAVGTKGAIYVDVYAQGLKIHTESGAEFPHTAYAPEFEGKLIGVLRDEILHFLECVREDKEPLVPGPEARGAVEVAGAIAQSLEQGAIVNL